MTRLRKMDLDATCFRCNGVTMELLPLATRLRINGFAHYVFSLTLFRLEFPSCVTRLSAPFSDMLSEWKFISNGPTKWICAARLTDPVKIINFERQSVLAPCFVLNFRAALRASQPPVY